jgi:hypothetical protein
MKYKVKMLIMVSVLMSLLAAQVATADIVLKSLYIDGTKVGSTVVPAGMSFPFIRLTIGSEGNRWYRYNGLVGSIDEFAVYSGVLSDARISAHYTATAANYVSAVQADAPKLYLRFEDAVSDNNTPADNSGSISGVDGTYIGAVGLVAGKVGNAAVFHGATGGTGDCIDVSDTNGAFNLTDVTIEFWVKTTQSSDYPRFFQHNGAGEEESAYGAMMNASTLSFGVIGGDTTTYFDASSSNLNDGSWRHVVITYDSTSSGGSYANAVLADDPCIYMQFDTDVSPIETIHHLYEFTDPVWGGTYYYIPKAEYGIGTSVGLKSQGGIGESIFLNYSNIPDQKLNSYVAVTRSTSIGYTDVSNDYAFAPDDITFELWYKNPPPPRVQSRYGMIFQQIGAYTQEPKAPGMGFDANELRILCGTQWWWPGATLPPEDQDWHQFVVTYDEQYGNQAGQMQVQFYMDGTFVNSIVVSDVNERLQAKLGPELISLYIGIANDRGYGYNGISGYVDEFAIYSGVLAADKIALHYSAFQPQTCQEAVERGYGKTGDINGDCKVDFLDFADMAVDWMVCNDPQDDCIQNW